MNDTIALRVGKKVLILYPNVDSSESSMETLVITRVGSEIMSLTEKSHNLKYLLLVKKRIQDTISRAILADFDEIKDNLLRFSNSQEF